MVRLPRALLVALFGIMVSWSLLLQCVEGGRPCHFPSRWSGKWFQKSAHPAVTIERNYFSTKGTCIDSDGDKFLIEDSREHCYRCVAIYEKHPNVLQYRETYCDDIKTLQQACRLLTVDAHLHSLFRVNATPEMCPFRGPFIFKYNRGQGWCENPMSAVDSCTDDSRILFRFQACADVMGTESSTEELTCLGTWKDGSAYYLVGKMVHKKYHSIAHVGSDNYRCFVYDWLNDKSGYQMSQSPDATCDGLVSTSEGSRIMKLWKTKHPSIGCHFPSWLSSPHKWHSLDGKRVYTFNQKRTSFRIIPARGSADHEETKVTCNEEHPNSFNYTMLIGYSTAGCDSGFVCIAFHQRDNHIVELQMGKPTRTSQDACSYPHYDMNQEFVTLVAPSPSVYTCPQLVSTDGLHVQGRATWRHDTCRDSAVMTGCRSKDQIEFLTSCPTSQDLAKFQCHGSWEENGKSFLITGLKGSQAKYCFVFSTGDKVTQLSGLHDTCSRSILPGITGNLTFNISAAGECNYITGAASSVVDPGLCWAISTVLSILVVSLVR